ncbi:MAG: DUF3365 domain-containing protein [Alphaproteobacteria bacterium]|nr:DUF3365 domain-containing protein [Alphaproteobacteria bacterium]
MWWVLTLLACGGAPDAPPASSPEAPPPAEAPVAIAAEPLDPAQVDRAVARGRAAIAQLGGTLKARMQAAMAEGGPVHAVETCASVAPGLPASVQQMTGVTLGRSSLRLRNPANEAPGWVKAWLEAQGERPVEGVDGLAAPAEDGSAEVHVIVPIGVDPLCLTCHGSAEQIPADVGSVIDDRYPQDAARGYAAGDLRGAFWASVPVTAGDEPAEPPPL